MTRNPTWRSQQVKDWKNLLAAIAAIRTAHPDATHAVFSTSDQQIAYGFVLTSVEADGRELNPARDLFDCVQDLVCDVDWNDVMEEDATGAAMIDLAVPRPRRRWRTLRHDGRTAYYHTRDRAVVAAQRHVKAGEKLVGIECWRQDIALDSDPVNEGWGWIGSIGENAWPPFGSEG